ncbi:nitrogen fixation protein NifM [Kaarinaea lacus]
MSVAATAKPMNQDDISYLLLRTALAQYEKSPNQLSETELRAVKRQVAKEYEIQNLILSSEEARDIYIPESVIDTSIGEVKSRYGDTEEFLTDIEYNGMSEQGFRAALVRELKVEAVLDRVSSKAVSISDMDIMIYYHMHYERFKVAETRTARHILITINSDYEENQKQNAYQRLVKIKARLDKKVKRFGEQALKHSECPTAMNGGLLGRVRQGELYPELDAALFSMKQGTVSDVIESELGFHILLCEQIHSAGTATLKEARPKIQKHLEDRARRMCQKAWLKQLVEGEK